MPKSFNYIFIDESGDPGKPYKIDDTGKKIPTGASLFYILSAVCLNSKKLFALEDRVTEVKNKFGYRSEIKAQNIPLELYKELLNIINELEIQIFYRLIDKTRYRGVFAVDGKKNLHNVFDEYNLAKTVFHAVRKCGFTETEVVIDRTDRRLLDGKFDNFNDYLMKRVNTKTKKRVSYITHVNSEYVYAMQMSDLISGAIKDYFTKRNTDLKKVIKKKFHDRFIGTDDSWWHSGHSFKNLGEKNSMLNKITEKAAKKINDEVAKIIDNSKQGVIQEKESDFGLK